jgi:hypothetical protein
MKRTVKVKVASYKWVIEDLCPQCDANTTGADIEIGANAPPPPAHNAKLRYGRLQPAAIDFSEPKLSDAAR